MSKFTQEVLEAQKKFQELGIESIQFSVWGFYLDDYGVKASQDSLLDEEEMIFHVKPGVGRGIFGITKLVKHFNPEMSDWEAEHESELGRTIRAACYDIEKNFGYDGGYTWDVVKGTIVRDTDIRIECELIEEPSDDPVYYFPGFEPKTAEEIQDPNYDPAKVFENPEDAPLICDWDEDEEEEFEIDEL